jgi:twitching motility protein PilT
MNTDDSRKLLLDLLKGTAQVRASDLHLRADSVPFVRIDGSLQRVGGLALSSEQITAIIRDTSGRNPGGGPEEWEYSFEETQGTRYRGHVFSVNGKPALAVRVIPSTVPSFTELRLPPVIKVLAEKSPGLVLITGPTGSGKTTTAASMLKHLAASAPLHVVTLEDPIEYRLVEAGSCISQREVGRDTQSFDAGLRAAMREDPDVLFVGEIRDRGTLDAAIQAAESGQLVLATFHTTSAVHTIQRMLSMFLPEEQAAARERIADALRGIVCQRLLPRKKARGRVLATEVLVNNYTVKECIRDSTRLKTLPTVLERGGDRQMHTLDQQLIVLAAEGLVEAAVALAYAAAPNDLRRTLSLGGANPTGV